MSSLQWKYTYIKLQIQCISNKSYKILDTRLSYVIINRDTIPDNTRILCLKYYPSVTKLNLRWFCIRDGGGGRSQGRNECVG